MGKMEAAEQTDSSGLQTNSLAATAVMRQLSTEQQRGWVERLFGRLEALYGASFIRQWENTNINEVKSVWAEKLGGFTAQQIGGAIKACDDRNYPPNLPEFVDLCRQAARREVKPPMIEAPQLSVEERMDRARKLDAAAVKPKEYDYRGWCKELWRRYLAGDDLLYIQIKLASEVLGEVWEGRQCKLIVTA